MDRAIHTAASAHPIVCGVDDDVDCLGGDVAEDSAECGHASSLDTLCSGVARSGSILARMCRNIRVLHNFEPPTTDDEVREAALQFVRKVSGSTRPSRANTEAFDLAVDEIAQATRRLLDGLVTNAPPKSREAEAAKGRMRHEQRMEREIRIRTAAG